jgi:hypothetical protein
MKTTLELPENLINEAMKLTQTETKTAVIILALQELVQKLGIAGIKKYRGKFDLDIDLNELRNRY